MLFELPPLKKEIDHVTADCNIQSIGGRRKQGDGWKWGRGKAAWMRPQSSEKMRSGVRMEKGPDEPVNGY